jgi:hypothetical protein
MDTSGADTSEVDRAQDSARGHDTVTSEGEHFSAPPPGMCESEESEDENARSANEESESLHLDAELEGELAQLRAALSRREELLQEERVLAANVRDLEMRMGGVRHPDVQSVTEIHDGDTMDRQDDSDPGVVDIIEGQHQQVRVEVHVEEGGNSSSGHSSTGPRVMFADDSHNGDNASTETPNSRRPSRGGKQTSKQASRKRSPKSTSSTSDSANSNSVRSPGQISAVLADSCVIAGPFEKLVVLPFTFDDEHLMHRQRGFVSLQSLSGE